MLIEKLAEQSGVSIQRIRLIVGNASRMYKTYGIPKRNGEVRKISQPTPELKAIQKWIVKSVFRSFPISSCATAYKKGASIKKNSEKHSGSLFTLHLDFENFFPSFSKANIENFLSDKGTLPEKDIEFCSSILTRYGTMTIGAPSSPHVSNTLMNSFDVDLNAWCLDRNLVYTRYADDINLSAFSPDCLSEAENYVRQLSENFTYAQLKINMKKTRYLSRKNKRTITGIILKPDGGVSIGRGRKREIHHFVHQYKLGSITVDEFWRIGGLVAFANDVEPEFVNSLRKKYGVAVVEEILHQKTPRGLKKF